jgi:hypothetical protein
MARFDFHRLRNGDVWWDGERPTNKDLPHHGCYVPLDKRCANCQVSQGDGNKIFGCQDEMLWFWVDPVYIENEPRYNFCIIHVDCKREKG